MILALAWFRLANEQPDGWKRHHQGQRRQHCISAAPADPVDQHPSQLRHDKPAYANPRQSNTEGETTPLIEPRRDRLAVADRSLNRACHLGQTEQQGENHERSWAQPDYAQTTRVDHDAWQSDAADAPAVHHYAEKRHGDGRKDAAKRQRERGRTAMPAHILAERLQKHAKSKAQHRTVADQQAGDSTEHHPPRVCELSPHRHPPLTPSSCCGALLPSRRARRKASLTPPSSTRGAKVWTRRRVC